MTKASSSVDFDGGVDFAYEHVGCVKADRPRQEPEGYNHQGGVAEIQQGGNELHNVQLEERE